MKKIFNILLFIGILVQNFTFVIPVVAEATESEEIIEIVSVKQGSTTLGTDEDSVYQITGTDKVILDYKVNNVDNVFKDDSLYLLAIDGTDAFESGKAMKNKNVVSTKLKFGDYFKNGNVNIELYECVSSGIFVMKLN